MPQEQQTVRTQIQVTAPILGETPYTSTFAGPGREPAATVTKRAARIADREDIVAIEWRDANHREIFWHEWRALTGQELDI